MSLSPILVMKFEMMIPNLTEDVNMQK